MNDDLINKEAKMLKDFNYLVFEGLSSCTEYTFQMDLIWIPNASSAFVEKVLATLEGGPFMTRPSTNSSLLKLDTISTDTDSIHFELTGNISKNCSKQLIFHFFISKSHKYWSN